MDTRGHDPPSVEAFETDDAELVQLGLPVFPLSAGTIGEVVSAWSTVIVRVDDVDLGVVDFEHRLIGDRYRLVAVNARARKESWFDFEQLRRLAYRRLVESALAASIEEASQLTLDAIRESEPPGDWHGEDGPLTDADAREFDAQLDREHASVAFIYLAARAVGSSPTRAVAERFRISRDAAAGRVKRARQAGYLPPTTKGRIET